MVKIGVVTVTFNSESVIKTFLHSLFSQTYKNFILYVIDNNSTDRTINILDKFNKPLVCIKNNYNQGVAKANNQGIRKAIKEGCSHILLINNDVEFEENVLDSLIFNHKSSNCSIITPKILYSDFSNTIWYAGSSFSKFRSYMPTHVGFRELDQGQYDTPSKVEYAPACCLLISKEVFSHVGFMDENFFVYFDDTDFCYRIKKNGRHNILYSPNIKIYHKVGGLTNMYNKNSRFKSNFFIEHNIKNHAYFLKKIGGLLGWGLIIWLLILINFRFIFSSSFKKNIHTWILINKSYIKGLKM